MAEAGDTSDKPGCFGKEMKELVFMAGGKLEYRTGDAERDLHAARTDVTQRAAAYLLEEVRVEGDVHLRDVFALLQDNPVLLQVFERRHASEFVDETRSVDPLTFTGEYDPLGTEYLELFHGWEIDQETGEVAGGQRLGLRAVGFELRDDQELSGCEYPRGSRIRYAVALSPLAELLNLPLRVNDDVCLAEAFGGTQTAYDALPNLRVRPTLAQVIEGVLYEISLGGMPDERAEVVEKLKQASADEAGWTTYDSAEALLESMGLNTQTRK